jgi:hypothetical protein
MSEDADHRIDLPLAAPVVAQDGCADACCADDASAETARPIAAHRRAVLSRRVRLLVAATITYNIVEAVVAISAGTVASSTALIGFGLDSVIEVASASAVAWQFSSKDPEARERVTLKIIVLRTGGLHHTGVGPLIVRGACR